MAEKIRSVFIESRSWFDKSGGNAYYSNRIHINGRVVLITGLRYGYDTQYLWDGLRELYNLGLILEPQSPYSLRQKIDLYHVQNSVPKRELFKDSPAEEDMTELYEAIA